MKEFYSVIKTLEAKQRFPFITVISKFSKASILSDLNNLIGITMMPDQAALLGYTHDELKRFFPGRLRTSAKGTARTRTGLLPRS